MRTPKAVPVVLRYRESGIQILTFAHPQAGTQIVKGTVEPGESVAEAAVRELAEESGITGATCARDLGTWEQCPNGQVWHFREMAVPRELPDAWSHFTLDGGGQLFKFSWHHLATPAPTNCHPVFAAALCFLRERLALSSQLAALPASNSAA